MSAGRARRLVAMARRLSELPETRASLEAGALSEDQVAVVCRHAPARHDAEAAAFARQATVAQLTRTLRDYVWEPEPAVTEEGPVPEPWRVAFNTTEEGSWRLSALLPPDKGAVVEAALEAARRAVGDGGEIERPTWADALVSMADRSLSAGATGRRHGDRHLVVVHLRADAPTAPGPTSTWAHPCPTPCVVSSAVTGGCNRSGRPRGWRSAWAGPGASSPSAPGWRWKKETGAVGCRAATDAGGCRSTTPPTGRTGVAPTPPTWWPCACSTIACITGEGWASPATPTTLTGWSSSTTGAGG